MKVMIISSSPNKEGLTAACASIAKEGAQATGAEVVEIRLNDLDINTCMACTGGWGQCLKQHECIQEDTFEEIHSAMKETDAFLFITPVYWGEMSESAKTFFDRLRRCEAWKESEGYLQNKPVIAVAAAGGSGNGIVSCLTSMEKLLMHLKAERFDFIGITKKSREYKLQSIKAASKAMCLSLKK